MNPETNFDLVERARGNGPAISQDELLDLLAELDAWRTSGDRCGIEDPNAMMESIRDLEARPLCLDDVHADYETLDRFFRDCEYLIGHASIWSTREYNAKRMVEELLHMNRQLGSSECT